MPTTTTKTFEYYEVELSESDVHKALTAFALDHLEPTKSVDMSAPVIIKSNQYRGFIVYLKKEDSKTSP